MLSTMTTHFHYRPGNIVSDPLQQYVVVRRIDACTYEIAPWPAPIWTRLRICFHLLRFALRP